MKLTNGIKTKIVALPNQISIESKANMALDLPYKILEDRARFNHIFSNPFDDASLFYFDKDCDVNEINCNSSIITQIVKHDGALVDVALKEYPSIIFPDANCMIVCDGYSTIIIHEKDNSNNWILVHSFRLECPFLMTDCMIECENLFVLAYKSEINTSEELRKSKFTSSLFKFNVNDSSSSTMMQTISSTGPLFSKIQKNGESFVIASEFPNDLIKEEITVETKSFEETTSAPLFQYNWTQTEEDVTIFVNLNSTIDKRFVNGRFTNKYVHLSLLHPLTVPIFNSETPLFDDINPTESIWTLEGNGQLLTLYLSKKNAPFRWTQLFLHDDSVQETFDVGVLEAYNQSLEKFTETPKIDTDVHPHTLTEKAEAIDFEGQSVSFVRCEKESGVNRITHRNFASGHEWLCAGFKNREICMGYDVDGLVYTLTDPFTFQHTNTFSAFNFIKNSKMEKQFICYLKSGRYAVIIEMKRYVFVYKREEGGVDKSDQMMIDLYDLERGADEFDSVIGLQQCCGETIALLRNKSIVFIDLNSV